MSDEKLTKEEFAELTKQYYHKDASCPKCGSSCLDDIFIGAGEQTRQGLAINEVIQRTCDRCHYGFCVLPIDYSSYPEGLVDHV